MTQVDIKYLEDKDGNKVAPITHVNAVRDSNGDTLPEILDRDYPTTSKTPVENSSEVSLCTRGEKYEWNKVGNATDATGASDITSTFKYLLLNGTTGAFETALKSYVEESVRAALGSLLNNLDKGTGVKAVAGIDNNNDLGSVTLSNLASVLGVKRFNYATWDGSAEISLGISTYYSDYGPSYLIIVSTCENGSANAVKCSAYLIHMGFLGQGIKYQEIGNCGATAGASFVSKNNILHIKGVVGGITVMMISTAI